MSQPTTFGYPLSGPLTPTVHGQAIDNSLKALLSMHSGVTAPAYKVQGTLWLDTAVPANPVLRVWSGSAWSVSDVMDATSSRVWNNIHPFVDVASAATVDLAAVATSGTPSVPARNIRLTGTTSITSFGPGVIGMMRKLRFGGALSLVSSANLVMPTSSSLTTAAGDTCDVICIAAGVWLVTNYDKISGEPVLLSPVRNLIASLSANTTIGTPDLGKIYSCTGTFTIALTAAATLANGFSITVKNDGVGIITIDPNGTELIAGKSTITLGKNQSCQIICDGTAFQVVGLQNRVMLYDEIAPSALTAFEVDIPLTYRRLFISASVRTTVDTNGGIQLSNDAGSTYLATSYFGAVAYGTSGGTAGSVAASTAFLPFSAAGLTSPSSSSGMLSLGNAAQENQIDSTYFTYAGGTGNIYNAGSFYNAALTNVNRIRYVLTSGQFSAGSRFTVEGIR
jgi:hypothetical protein